MRESKECAECGGIYFRAEKVSDLMWEARRYCSPKCSGTALAKRMKVAVAEGKAVPEFPPPEPVPTPVPAPKEPVMRELKIVRVGPNPRLVTCEYFELAQRRLCTVLVKRTAKFVRGMKFKMPEPQSEEAYRRPWVYTGPPPKHRGRW